MFLSVFGQGESWHLSASEHIGHGVFSLHSALFGDVSSTWLHHLLHAWHVFTTSTAASAEVTVLDNSIPRIFTSTIFFTVCKEVLFVDLVCLLVLANEALTVWFHGGKFGLCLLLALTLELHLFFVLVLKSWDSFIFSWFNLFDLLKLFFSQIRFLLLTWNDETTCCAGNGLERIVLLFIALRLHARHRVPVGRGPTFSSLVKVGKVNVVIVLHHSFFRSL
jgi:hypothetical protein